MILNLEDSYVKKRLSKLYSRFEIHAESVCQEIVSVAAGLRKPTFQPV